MWSRRALLPDRGQTTPAEGPSNSKACDPGSPALSFQTFILLKWILELSEPVLRVICSLIQQMFTEP